MKKRTFVCFLIFIVCVFHSSLPGTVFGQNASLAQRVLGKYSHILQREDIQAVLPDALEGLKAPDIQELLNPTVITAAVANPDLLGLVGVEQRFINLLKTDAELRAMLGDAQVQALLQDTAAIDELAAALRVADSPVARPVTQPSSLAQQVFEKYSATLLRADIQAVLPEVLTDIKAPEIQERLNPVIISAAITSPDLLALIGVEQRFINLLKTNGQLRTMLSDTQVQALLLEPAAIDELAALVKAPRPGATAGPLGYPRGAVIISEIMVDSGGGTLPQWLELYNPSRTEARNLSGWTLEIQNVDSADLVGRLNVALTLQEKVIQPNQTLLIVAGYTRAASVGMFPARRVYNLLALHQQNLRINTSRDTFLSAKGFHLKLSDRNGRLVDEVGNTDGNWRTNDIPAWNLPWSPWWKIRSSLIRRYDNGVALDGTARSSWALAANINKVVEGTLYYGHVVDIGTPGYRHSVLPVELSSFTVTRNDSGAVVVTWTTESEVDNAGFNLRRSEKRNSGFTLLNPALIAGAGTTGELQTYTFTDTSAKPGVAYYYQIEEISFGGKRETLATRRLRGPVSAVNRELTTLGAVKQRK